MHASRVVGFGPPSALDWCAVPDPRPAARKVVVEVAAAGVNRADALFRAGRYPPGPGLPATPGLEAAGRIVAVGGDARSSRSVSGFWRGAGSATRGSTPSGPWSRWRGCCRCPMRSSCRPRPGLPVAWLTAWYCLRKLGEVRPGDDVLVHAGASGVGSAAVQIAKDAGARVIATAGGPEKRAWCVISAPMSCSITPRSTWWPRCCGGPTVAARTWCSTWSAGRVRGEPARRGTCGECRRAGERRAGAQRDRHP